LIHITLDIDNHSSSRLSRYSSFRLHCSLSFQPPDYSERRSR